MKAKNNKKIGILDMNIDSMYLINQIRETFKDDDIYYINDMQLETYEEMEEKDIFDYVNKNVNFLLSKDIDLLVIANDTIIEYCEDLIENIKIPIVHIVNETINFINKYFEFKNIGFLAPTSIIEANIYQKNFRYNHLYNLNGDELIKIIRNQLVKTSETFQEVKNIVTPFRKKDLDIIVPSLVNFCLLDTEFLEFVKRAQILRIDKIICDAINHQLYHGEERSITSKKPKGKTYIYIKQDISKDVINRFVKCKYELINPLNVK